MLFKPGPLVSEASGKIGGVVAAHNRGGQYLRQFRVPTNPSTAQQEAVRNALSDLVSYWNSALTQADRDEWDVYAANVARTNRLGDTVFLNGQQTFLGYMVPRVQADDTDIAIIDKAPANFDRGEFTTPSFDSFTAASGTFDLAFDNADEWANESGSALLVYVGRPQNETVNFFKGPYQLAGIVKGDDTTAPTSPATITSPFAFADGQKLFVSVAVTRVDGRLSSRRTFSGISA